MGEVSTAAVPFSVSEDQSASQLGGAAPTVINAIMDTGNVVRRRPGISAWSAFPSDGASGSAVIGMHPYGQQLIYVTEDRKIHAVSAVGGIVELSSATSTTWLDGGGRPYFVPGRNMMVIAGGGAMQKWTGTGLTSRLTNTGAGGDPPDASSICAVAQRLVAQPPGESGLIWWTGPLEAYENWDLATGGAGYIQAAAKPDKLLHISDNTNEIFAFGYKTIQVFVPSAIAIDDNDPNNILNFATLQTMEIGTLAPDSVIPWDTAFMLLERNRRFMLTDARTFKDLSKPVAGLLLDMQNVENCWGFRMKYGRFDAAVWMFPTDGYGIVYDAILDRWCEWRAWGTAYTPVTITSAYNWSEVGVFLVGLSDGSIAKLDDTVSTDLGSLIPIEVTSGFVSHGTMTLKHCRNVTMMFKRNQSPSTSSGFVRLSYRDDEGDWTFVDDISLSDDFSPFVQIFSLGTYRARQWKVRYTGSDEVQFVGMQEEFETLGV